MDSARKLGEMGTSASLEIRAQRWVQHVVVSGRGQGVAGVPLPLSLHVLNATTKTKHRDERDLRAHTRCHQHSTLPHACLSLDHTPRESEHAQEGTLPTLGDVPTVRYGGTLFLAFSSAPGPQGL